MPQGIDDNYVDDYFLKGLVHKSNIIELSFIDSFPDLRYPQMIRETLELVNVPNTLGLFIVYFIAFTIKMSFLFLLRGDYELESFSLITMGGTVCYGFFLWMNK